MELGRAGPEGQSRWRHDPHVRMFAGEVDLGVTDAQADRQNTPPATEFG
ncbi:hypothetical protein [Nocardia kruczakiae]|nr:hypothetical protein [Nocardia kruczakiae]